MNAHTKLSAITNALRAEAAIEPDAPITTTPTKTTQIIAIYGKGGIGKSFTLANLSYMMAQQGKKVLLIGCDPKSDTTSLLFGGRACPTIIETSTRKKLAGEAVAIEDVCFKRDGVFAMELGGPEVGRGCGGRGIMLHGDPVDTASGGGRKTDSNGGGAGGGKGSEVGRAPRRTAR